MKKLTLLRFTRCVVVIKNKDFVQNECIAVSNAKSLSKIEPIS